MTSTNTFQGMDASAKPSSRVLRPPGGGSSNIFGGGDETASAGSRANKMASTIFAPPDEPLGCPKRTNPPGGKSSGIFAEAVEPTPQQRPVPAGGVSSNIFGEAVGNPPTVRSHPNKPKDNIGVNATPQPEVPKQVEKPAEKASAPSTPSKEDTPKQQADLSPCQPPVDNHEPRLGPRPRSHNKVIHPPGGKSSVAFY
ncbi:jupiter microtubule associated homolog 2-like [Megalops cyprinoides]|uniref:jupiter microtubule associated homolog 2-like n=1 Tax=Megalops cyprinoides TaxID=118141 RepID=UPI00186500BA|nr:jupiter microtubule associated homolog 2-like [Megalops cyprinoides]